MKGKSFRSRSRSNDTLELEERVGRRRRYRKPLANLIAAVWSSDATGAIANAISLVTRLD